MSNNDTRINRRALLCTVLMTFVLYAMLWWAAPPGTAAAAGAGSSELAQRPSSIQHLP
jgi:hypothetical protein